MLTFLRSLMFVLAKSSQTDQNSSQIQHIPSLLFHWCHFKNSNIFIATLLRERGSFTPQQSDRWLPVSPVLWLVLSHRAVSVSTKPMDTRWLGSCSRCVHRQRDRLSGVLLSEERKSPQSSVLRQSKSQGGLKQFRRTHGNCSWCLQLTAAPPGYSKSPHTPFTTAGPVGVWVLQLHGEHAPKALGSAFLLAATLSQCHLAFVSGHGVTKASWKLGMFEVIQRDDVKSPLHSHYNIVLAEPEQGWSLGMLAGGELELQELLLNSWINWYNFSQYI